MLLPMQMFEDVESCQHDDVDAGSCRHEQSIFPFDASIYIEYVAARRLFRRQKVSRNSFLSHAHAVAASLFH